VWLARGVSWLNAQMQPRINNMTVLNAYCLASDFKSAIGIFLWSRPSSIPMVECLLLKDYQMVVAWFLIETIKSRFITTSNKIALGGLSIEQRDCWIIPRPSKTIRRLGTASRYWFVQGRRFESIHNSLESVSSDGCRQGWRQAGFKRAQHGRRSCTPS
jgi:hypothetical protein